ncbi:glycoside hydrolase family 73 protein [Telluria aromaticivorans]|uniref:Flagellar assembly peptidoglycan hydrolase FlgJ n=1 Tax=Telluria aromaticivorans TaxID=2725995 RepID=A0A7Y2K1E5_9BURK|nr:glucosaminidase domain-containing protein [Telluria aromaticivorans]NNG24310.1 flagellar assembly peptidoglycan hydrolase FlgJ [Telluria aromaticivorans]
MRHADFATAPLSPLAPTAATRPTAAIGGGSGFGNMFGEVQGEVAAYIQNGDGGESGAAALSAEGSIWHARAAGLISGENEVDGVDAVSGADTTPEQQAFLDSIAPWARQAGEQLGVAPELVSAHAALESGWGQRPLRNGSGESSHNLFGIKAGSKWEGAVSESATTEYIGGAAIKTRERFRSYPDAGSAFRDYAQMLADNPRYKGALGVGNDAKAFAQGLAKGGYATDPAYAAKLTRLATKLQGSDG